MRDLFVALAVIIALVVVAGLAIYVFVSLVEQYAK